MISVVISTFNRGERLKKAVESVLAQTYQDFEIIIVDDASNDDKTRDILDELGTHEKIVMVRLGKNFGNDTRPKNEGIKMSKGEYVAFLDDDCEFRPDHLQSLLNELEKNPKLSMVYGDRWIIDEEKRFSPRIGVYSEFDPGILFKANYIDTSDVLVRREALLKVGGFDERYKKYVDWNLWLRMAKYGMSFKRVPLIITDYHIHNDQKSAKVQTEGDKKTGQFVPEWNPYDVEVELPYLKEVEEPKVAIFTLTMDRLEYTKACFEAIHKTAGYDFEHYIFDNGSKDGTVDWLKEYEASHKGKVHVIYSEDNKGISLASNRVVDEIVRQNKFRVVVKLDNDCLTKTEGWLAKMVEIWKSNHKLALSCYVEKLRDNPGGAQRIAFGEVKKETIGMTRHLGGILHFVDAQAYTYFRWDTHDFLHGVQDLEFSQYLLRNGFQMGYLENYFVEHYKGTEQQEKEFPRYFERRKQQKQTRYI